MARIWLTEIPGHLAKDLCMIKFVAAPDSFRFKL